METRPFDVVLYGATGFTGKQTAQYFAKHVGFPGSVRWAIAGRNRSKLEQVRQSLGPQFQELPILIADSLDETAVDAMIAQTRVLLTTAGPYALYGEKIVAACVKHKVDYVDITGETLWVRHLIDTYHEQAKQDGTRIIPFCGFDSIPSDIGAFFVIDYMRREWGQACKEVRAYFKAKGGLNGGTLASALNLFASGEVEQLRDPVLLNPRDKQTNDERMRSPDQQDVRYEEELKCWSVPFFMAPVNTRVVRRSNALFAEYGAPYGPQFTYHECMDMRSKMQATLFTAGSQLFEKQAQKGWVRKLMEKWGPSPGEGPSEATMDGGFFRTKLLGIAEDGRKVWATFTDQGDPGNRVTVKCLCESALTLAMKRGELPGGPTRGGILTPATALGAPLIQRLQQAGMTLKIDP